MEFLKFNFLKGIKLIISCNIYLNLCTGYFVSDSISIEPCMEVVFWVGTVHVRNFMLQPSAQLDPITKRFVARIQASW